MSNVIQFPTPDNVPALAPALSEALTAARAQATQWGEMVQTLEAAIASGDSTAQQEALATFDGMNDYSPPEPF